MCYGRNKEPAADKPLFAGIFALLFVPALIILAIAFASGYMVSSDLRRSIAFTKYI
jgi:hypothetical protein